jgi:hypothetical protein
MDIGIKGSFVITAVCPHGIIVASESRANIFDKSDPEHRPIAYYDTEQKVFPLGQFAIAQTGQGLLFNVFFSAIVSRFGFSKIQQIDELLPAFLRYSKQSYPPELFHEIVNQKLFAAGYADSRPTICYFNNQQNPIIGCIQDEGFVQSAPTTLSVGDLDKPLDEVVDAVESAITTYASVSDRWKTIGSSVSVLLITETDTQWIRNPPCEQRWIYLQQFVQDYFDGTVEISVIPPATRDQLDELLSTVKR